MQTYRIAILGCRARGTSAARAYHAHPRTEVVGLCDLVPDLLDTLGDELGVRERFSDYNEMIRTTEPDIVAIPTGTEFHYELAMGVLEHGVNIDIEKPICVNLQQADDVVAKARDKGCRIAVHHQHRLNAWLLAVHQAYKEGRIGELLYIYTRDKGYYGGFGVMNIGTHKVNNIQKFAGPCRAVNASATTDGRNITPEDVIPSPSGMGVIAGEYINATLEFDDNITATLLQQRLPGQTNLAASVIELFGTEGRLLWNRRDAWHLPTPHLLPDGEHDRWQALEPIFPEHYDEASPASHDDYWFVEEYVQALDEGRDHECDGADALRVLETMMAIFESAAYGRRVELPQNDREHPLVRWRLEHGLGEPDPAPQEYGAWLAQEDARLGRGQ
jgi:predicted dehydrogenase